MSGACALLALLPLVQEPAPAASAVPLQVQSFNLRYAGAPDGEDRWELRRDRAARFLEEHPADLVAFQEVEAVQLAWLRERLPGWTLAGAFRGAEGGGEWVGLALDPKRLELLEQEVFWLSETPELPGSRSWDAALPRVAILAILRDRAGGARFQVLATHLDHRGPKARLESARRIAARLRPGLPALVLGDLNADEGSPPLEVLLDAGLRDTFRLRHPRARAPGELGTFHGFRPEPDGRRIDWILAGPEWEILAAAIHRDRYSGRAPSDHTPVSARLLLRP